MNRTILTFFLWLGCFVSLYAQVKDTVSILQVEVTSRTSVQLQGLNRTTMDSLTMKTSISGNLSDLLTRYSSIFIKNYGEGGLATASFRGTSASHTQVFWNNVPINSPMVGSVDLSLLPVFFADDISILYGSSSLLTGSGALGGSIEIENKPQWNNRYKFSVLEGMGSFQNYQSFLAAGFGGRVFQSNTRIIWESGFNNYPYYNSNTETNMIQTNDNFSKTGIMQEIYFRIGSNDIISMKAWVLNSNRNIPSLMPSDTLKNSHLEFQKDQSANAVASWKHIIPQGNITISTGMTISNLFFHQRNETLNVNFLQDSSFYRSSIGFIKADLTSAISNWLSIIAGCNINRSQVLASNYQYDPSSKYSLSDSGFSASRLECTAFLKFNALLNKKVNLYFLFRQGSDNATLEPFIPSLTAEYQLMDHNQLSVEWNVARNYHLPSLDDLYFIPGGNAKLQPEVGYTSDLVINQHYNHGPFELKSRISGYASYIYNWIVWNYTAFNLWTPENDKVVFARGLEVYLNTELNYSHGKFGAKGNFSFTRTTSQEHDNIEGSDSYGKQLIFIPQYLYNMLFFADFEHWYLNYSLNYTGNRYSSSDDNPESLLPRYLLNNMAIGRTFSLFSTKSDLQFQVNNIFNASYQPIRGMIMPGINFEILFQIHFNQPL